MRVLLTGMSGSGKSTLVQELRRRGYAAYDADDDQFSEPRADGRWGWRADAVASLLAQVPDGELLFFAGCSEEQIEMPFDYRVVLTVPEDEIVMRLSTRTSNAYGRMPAERGQVLADLAQIEPLLRRSADLILSTAVPVAEIADRLLGRLSSTRSAGAAGVPGRGGELHRDAEPAGGPGGEGEGSVVCLGDALDDRQAEADTCVVGADASGCRAETARQAWRPTVG